MRTSPCTEMSVYELVLYGNVWSRNEITSTFSLFVVVRVPVHLLLVEDPVAHEEAVVVVLVRLILLEVVLLLVLLLVGEGFACEIMYFLYCS